MRDREALRPAPWRVPALAVLLWVALAAAGRAEQYRVGLGFAEDVTVPDAASFLKRLPGPPPGARPVGQAAALPDPPATRPRAPGTPPVRHFDPITARAPLPDRFRKSTAAARSPDGTFQVDAARIDASMNDEASMRHAWELFAREPAALPEADRLRNAVIKARLARDEPAEGVASGRSSEVGELDLGIQPGHRPGPRSPPLAPASPRGAGSPLVAGERDPGAPPSPEVTASPATTCAERGVAERTATTTPSTDQAPRRAVVREPGTWIAEAPFGRGTRFLPARSVIWLLPGGHGVWRPVSPPAGPGWACVLYLDLDAERR